VLAGGDAGGVCAAATEAPAMAALVNAARRNVRDNLLGNVLTGFPPKLVTRATRICRSDPRGQLFLNRARAVTGRVPAILNLAQRSIKARHDEMPTMTRARRSRQARPDSWRQQS
jgi:hypothetical protein